MSKDNFISKETVDTMETVLFTNLSERIVREARLSAVMPFIRLIGTMQEIPVSRELTKCKDILLESVKSN